MKTRLTYLVMLAAILAFTSKISGQCIVDAGPNKTFCCAGSDTIRATFLDTVCLCQNRTYQWTPTTGLSNPNILNPVVTPVGGTTMYKLCVTSYSGKFCGAICCYVCDSMYVTRNNSCCRLMEVGEKLEKASSLKVFPNPANDVIFIEAAGQLDNSEATVTDVTGRVVFQKSNLKAGEKIQLNVAIYPRGVYFIQLKEQGKETQVVRVLLE